MGRLPAPNWEAKDAAAPPTSGEVRVESCEGVRRAGGLALAGRAGAEGGEEVSREELVRLCARDSRSWWAADWWVGPERLVGMATVVLRRL